MIHIEVDYQGPVGEEVYSFVSTDEEYMSKLDEIANYKGGIDRITLSIGRAVSNQPHFDINPKQIIFSTTNVGLAISRAKKLNH